MSNIQYCDCCGQDLDLVEQVETLDTYMNENGKIIDLVQCEFECDNCGNGYLINVEIQRYNSVD